MDNQLAKNVRQVDNDLMRTMVHHDGTTQRRFALSEPRAVQLSAAAYLVAFVVHTADHARRGIADTPEGVVWIGTLGSMVFAVLFTLLATAHPARHLVGAVGAAAHAVGVSFVHLLPGWRPISERVLTSSYDGWTRVAVIAEVAGAAWFALACLRVSRGERPSAGAAPVR